MLLGALAACEKVSHDNIERWENTDRGETKLRSALSGDHDAELRAHAAQVLIRLGQHEHVLAILGGARERERAAILPPLVERLWRDARLEGELARPQPHHVLAKDALFELRELATPSLRGTIDQHLIAWLTGGYYEGRSRSGRYSGRRIIRGIGAGAGAALVEAAREVLARPPDDQGRRVRLGDELLGSLALSGDPKALSLLVDLVEQPQVDSSLPDRAARALRGAFIKSSAATDTIAGAALKPIAPRLQSLAMADKTDPGIADAAVDLLAAMGMPGCLPVFVELVAHDHPNPSFRWVATQNGIRCAGVAGIAPITGALPPRGGYAYTLLDRYLWSEILALPNKEAVAAAARQLLVADSWVAKVTGVQLLGKLQSSGDAERVQRLAKSRTRLRGWYQQDAKPDPTLGQVAERVARDLRKLREVAQPTKSR